MCQRSTKGSITIFMSLLLMLVASLLFTLLEGSRYLMLGMTAVLNSQSVTESVFAEYNVPAYHNYHLFMMDGGYGSGEFKVSEVNARMQELGQENLNPAVMGFGRYHNFLQMDVTDSSVVQYQLATDRHAEALLKQMAQVMKKELAADLAQQAFKKLTDMQQSCEQGKEADAYLDGALDTIEQAKESAKEATKEAAQQAARGANQMHLTVMRHVTAGYGQAPSYQKKAGYILKTDTGNVVQQELTVEEIENPMEDIKSAKGSPLLSQILSDGKGISAKQVSKEDSVEKRPLNVGNYEEAASVGAADKLLVVQYLKKYTSNYLHEISVPHALAYEQEYILFGKYTDEDNLKKMASRLLLIREGMNFAYLMTDSAKREEALAMATAIAIATGIPAAAKAIQMGILASWAYAESIAELRTLFLGGKIAAVKTAGNWNVSLSEAAAVPFQTSIKAKEVNNGLDYEDYLCGFFLLEGLNKIGSRFANLLEKNIRLFAGYEQVKLDCMVTAMETNNRYKARQVFLTFVTVGRLSRKGYEYEETYRFSYDEPNTGRSEADE